MKQCKALLWPFWVMFFMGCASLDGEPEVPKITESLTTKEALLFGFEWGGDTFVEAKNLVKKRQDFETASGVAEAVLLSDLEPSAYMWRAMQVYQGINKKFVSPKLIRQLISSNNEFVRRMGWQLSAIRPSDLVKVVLEKHLTDAVISGAEAKVLLPEMAAAVKANGLADSYSLLREGLFEKGGVEFVSAMIEFNANRALEDFIVYLARATVEDLRQKNQTTIDLPTSLAILKFLNEKKVPVGHPNLAHLYLYAVSRNIALADLAMGALEKSMADNRSYFAFSLAKLPVWIQVAFVENSREHLDSNLGLFLAELKDVTTHAEVIEEINGIRL